MDMLSLLDKLEAVLKHSIRVPVGGKRLVDEEVLFQILKEMRAIAPDEVRLGQRIAGERERILADARAQAQRMLGEAQTHAHSRLDEQGVVQAAQERARTIIAEAEQRAASQRAEADQYTLAQLTALENRLQRLLREVQAGQRFLASNLAEEDAAKSVHRS
jgi:vacuolar-type H+-ATPase subunit H